MIYQINEYDIDKIDAITKYQYDFSWLILTLVDNNDNTTIVGTDNNGSYTIKINKSKHENWRLAVGDFIEYCNANKINAILQMSQMDYADALNHYSNHHFNERLLREYEPSILIHSTTMESWLHIQQDGMLKSWNKLKSEKVISEKQPIGIQLGDPISFSDYIMFGHGVSGEIVVNSKQSGKIVMDINAIYQTGARLYFNAQKMAEDGLLVRDGCHLKVKDTLCLATYLIWVATWDKVGLLSQSSTPKIFAQVSDKQFQALYHEVKL